MPELHHIPRQRRGHHLEEMNGESVLFGRAGAKAFFLNDTASVVWKLCDGTRSVQAIIDVLTETYPDSGNEIAADVAHIVDQMSADGLIALEEPPAG